MIVHTAEWWSALKKKGALPQAAAWGTQARKHERRVPCSCEVPEGQSHGDGRRWCPGAGGREGRVFSRDGGPDRHEEEGLDVMVVNVPNTRNCALKMAPLANFTLYLFWHRFLR